jgi:hypothetical protein
MTKSSMTDLVSVIALVCVTQLGACSEEPPPASVAQAPPAMQPQPAAPQPATLPSSAVQQQVVAQADTSAAAAAPAAGQPATPYTAESLESLLAPVALYPDPVLSQVLATSTNPQEVLDAGNWLIKNPDLSGSALESAAITAGFTPPMVALVQFPTVVDMMCMQMDWTTELGTAFLADQKGVLDAVQRLRKQASELGNLESSKQMKVTTESVNNQDVIVVQPAQPEVVYVPQYNPTTVYTTPAPATTTTQVVTTDDDDDDDDGYSGGEMITAGLLSFGAGILVNEVFDDDDDDYYHTNWGGGYPPPYYPPPYQPRYGNGYYPSHGYQRPANYQRGFNNNNVFVNADGDNYFNRFDRGSNNYRRNPDSPISRARQNRPELGQLDNRRQELARPDRPVQGSYAGRSPEVRQRAGLDRRSSTAASRATTGTYAGAKPGSRPQVGGTRDRGRTESAARPSGGGKVASAAQRPQSARSESRRPSGFQGSQGSGRQERAASKRGRESMSQRPRPSSSARSGRSGGGRSGGRAGGRR